MASPVVQQAIESASPTTATTNHTVTLPTATAGDLLIIIADQGSTAATITVTAGPTLTELLDESAANGLYIAYRWMDGTESATLTLTTSASTRLVEIAYRISGAENPATQPPEIATTGTGTSATPDPPNIVAPASSKDYLFIAFAGMAGEEADDDTWGNTPPTNYTPSPPRQKTCGTVGSNLGGVLIAAERQLTTGAAENPGTFGVDVSAAWRAQTIRIHPVTTTPVDVSDSATAADVVTYTVSMTGDDAAVSDEVVYTMSMTTDDASLADDIVALTSSVSLSESGLGADGSVLTAAIPVTDTGSAADTAPTLGKTVADSAVGADVWANTVQAATDTAVGTDISLVSVPVVATDAGSGADASVLTVVYPVTESVSSTDASVLTAILVVTDLASVADTSSVSVAGVDVAASDAASGADVSALTAVLVTTDLGAAADATLTLARPITDIATASDAVTTLDAGSNNVASDAGTTSDTAVLTFAIPAADVGTAVDAATVEAPTSATISNTLPSLTQAVTAVSITPLAPAFDSFNRADGAIGTSDSGHTWIAQSGTWDISTNRVYRASSDMQSTVVIDSGFTSCSLSVDATFPAVLQDSGVVFADIDDDNYLLYVFEASGPVVFELRLWKRDAGAFTLLSGPHPAPNYANTTKRARVEWDAASGDIALWFDGVRIEALTLGETDRAKYAVGTRQGLRENAVPAGDKTYFDNYSLISPSLPALQTQVMARSANTTGWSDPASDTTFVGAGTQVIVVTAGV